MGIVAGGVDADSVSGILGGNTNIIDTIDNVIPGLINFQLHMAGRTLIKLNATGAVMIYMSYEQRNPSLANHDYAIDYNEFMAKSGVELDLAVTEFKIFKVFQ